MKRILPALFIVLAASWIRISPVKADFGDFSGQATTQVSPCANLPATERIKCEACYNKGTDPGDYSYTALGCVPTQPEGFVSWFLKLALGLGGITGLIFLIYGGFIVLTSAGNPDNINKGREMIFSTLAGLFLIAFSLIILEVIGGDILKIPFFQ